jgi:hypothetical protein
MSSRVHTEVVTEPGSPRDPRRDGRQVVTISDIGTSRPAEIRDRERRYVFAMLIRVVCFIAATLLFTGVARWIAIGVAIAMPWIAVVFANAPAVRKTAFAKFVPAAPRTARKLDKAREHRVIDVDLQDIHPPERRSA